MTGLFKKNWQSLYGKLTTNVLANAVCAAAILAWVTMVNLAAIAQTEIISGAGGEFWQRISQLAEPPVKLWALLLIPSSFAVLLLFLFERATKLLRWYVIIVSGLILMLGFTILRVLMWGPHVVLPF